MEKTKKMKPEEHYVFINKELENGKLKKVGLYGSIVELARDNNIILKNDDTANHYQVRKAVNNDHYEDENICIKKCKLQRSKKTNQNHYKL